MAPHVLLQKAPSTKTVRQQRALMRAGSSTQGSPRDARHNHAPITRKPSLREATTTTGGEATSEMLLPSPSLKRPELDAQLDRAASDIVSISSSSAELPTREADIARRAAAHALHTPATKPNGRTPQKEPTTSEGTRHGNKPRPSPLAASSPAAAALRYLYAPDAGELLAQRELPKLSAQLERERQAHTLCREQLEEASRAKEDAEQRAIAAAHAADLAASAATQAEASLARAAEETARLKTALLAQQLATQAAERTHATAEADAVAARNELAALAEAARREATAEAATETALATAALGAEIASLEPRAAALERELGEAREALQSSGALAPLGATTAERTFEALPGTAPAAVATADAAAAEADATAPSSPTKTTGGGAASAGAGGAKSLAGTRGSSGPAGGSPRVQVVAWLVMVAAVAAGSMVMHSPPEVTSVAHGGTAGANAARAPDAAAAAGQATPTKGTAHGKGRGSRGDKAIRGGRQQRHAKEIAAASVDEASTAAKGEDGMLQTLAKSLEGHLPPGVVPTSPMQVVMAGVSWAAASVGLHYAGWRYPLTFGVLVTLGAQEVVENVIRFVDVGGARARASDQS